MHMCEFIQYMLNNYTQHIGLYADWSHEIACCNYKYKYKCSPSVHAL